MRSGNALLRDLNARLNLPSRVRSDVLREVRDDLRDMVAVLVGQGMSPEEAERRACGEPCARSSEYSARWWEYPSPPEPSKWPRPPRQG